MTATAAEVVELFESVLGRQPESEGVIAHHVAMGLDRAALLALLQGSSEARERARQREGLEALATHPRRGLAEAGARGPTEPARVMLWGAYGNGNLGDGAQAMALADLLRPMLPDDTVIVASSWERRGGYDAPGGVALDPDALLQMWRSGADRVDLLVIGGGGLFGTPHFPLHEPAWVDAVVASGISVVLLGVGGAALALAVHSRAYDALLRHAALVGARDVETLLAIRSVRPDAIWFPDPVLARAVLAPTRPTVAQRPIDVLLIPREPNGAADAAALDAMLDWRTAALTRGMRVEVAILEPVIDRRALAARGFAGVAHEPADWPTLLALCARSHVVASLRLHGAIGGLEAGCLVYGLVQPKTRLLFEELGLEAWFGLQWPTNGPPPAAGIDAFATAQLAGFATVRARLGDAMTMLRTAVAGALG